MPHASTIIIFVLIACWLVGSWFLLFRLARKLRANSTEFPESHEPPSGARTFGEIADRAPDSPSKLVLRCG